ncbi:MAG: hypothetical protein PSV16_01550 [Flavobacterium sp.]|nr:hypothetical protein [Flavobacterium sp.]
MKKIVLLLLSVFALNACSINDDEPKLHFEVLPVEGYTVPESFTSGQTYEIKATYFRPTDCYFLEGLYFEKEGDTRTIGFQCSVMENSNCQPLDYQNPYEVKFNFQVLNAAGTSYTFKFYKGEDANGNNLFDEVVIPVN